jgi:hypothetical protein
LQLCSVWRPVFLPMLAIALLALGAGSVPPPRHVVLIVADDLGYGDLGYTGSDVKTPTLDGLAKSGVILSSYYVQRACSPTRASILSARYNIRYGMQSGVLETGQLFGLDLNETMLPQALRKSKRLIERSQPKSATCDSTSFHANWDCHGGGIKPYTPAQGINATSDPGKCCKLCSKVPECQVWTIFHEQCYLKSNTCEPVTHTGSTTGGNTSFTPGPTPGPTPQPTLPNVTCPPAPKPAPDDWVTTAIGKWHVGFFQWAYTPTFRGFDSYLGSPRYMTVCLLIVRRCLTQCIRLSDRWRRLLHPQLFWGAGHAPAVLPPLRSKLLRGPLR